MDSKYKIKELPLEDLNRALTLVWVVFSEFQAPGYSEEGVNHFKNIVLKEEKVREYILACALTMFACYDGENIIGVAAVRVPAHIMFLFVDKEHHRRGVARGLFEAILAAYKNKTDEITVNSSPYALEAYHKLGFVDTEPEQEDDGIKYTPMKYTIKN
ncbi:GNAT superfamily N-acetyltransferase [Elusimicrobium simillimum]|uniref:GNAT family N-acetyltransferase n=1 Tax=Elusimicrobium simillimum TaxID=3143438 RepID=UPI003C702532